MPRSFTSQPLLALEDLELQEGGLVQPAKLTSSRAVFMFALAVVKFKALLLMRVCMKYMDGTTFEFKVPRLGGSVGDLRAAVAIGTEVAATTIGLFVADGDGEELRDNQRLVDAVGRNVGPRGEATAFALPRDARWTCTLCACTNGRAGTACTDCEHPRSSTAGQSSALLVAAGDGNMEEVLALVAAAVPLDALEVGSERRTALIIASQHGHLAVVEALLAAGADKDAKTEDGFTTALSIAIEDGHLAVVEVLLAAGADKDATTPDGCTILFIACIYGHLAVVQALLAAGASKDTKAENGGTALIIASERGYLAVVQTLLAAGAEKDAAKDNGATALFIASRNGHLAVVQALLAVGADKHTANHKGTTALLAARQNGHLAVVGVLAAAAEKKDKTERAPRRATKACGLQMNEPASEPGRGTKV
jgi:ankyrin repeat protein